MLVRQFALRNLDLDESEHLPLSIVKAMADIDLDLNLSGPKLDALINAQLVNVQMAIARTADSELAEAVAGVSRFGPTTLIQGRAPDYLTKIESDIDRVLQQAVAQIVQRAGRQLESRIKAAVADQTEGPIDEVRRELKGMDILGAQLSRRLNLGNEVLKNIVLPF